MWTARLLGALLLLLCFQLHTHASAGPGPTVPATAASSLGIPAQQLDDEAARLSAKYGKRFVRCSVPLYPHCDVYLCGTPHVAKTSAEMVSDVVRGIKPHFVVLELCESRLDSLYEIDTNEQLAANVTLGFVLRSSWEDRSFKTLGMGLLSWMQLKAAAVMGSKLGGELSMAAKEGALLQPPAHVVLGDRLYGVTIQRVFDELGALEKLRMGALLLWEVVTLSVFRLKEYVRKTEVDDDFINDEIARFGRWLPTFARVIVGERDEYMAQTLLEIARVGFGDAAKIAAAAAASAAAAAAAGGVAGVAGGEGGGGRGGRGGASAGAVPAPPPRGRILAVCGAAHLAGIQRCLAAGGCSEEHVRNISSSSKHNATWPGRGMLQVVNSKLLWGAAGPGTGTV